MPGAFSRREVVRACHPELAWPNRVRMLRRAAASRSSGGAAAALGPTTMSLQDATAEGVAQSCVVQGRPLLLTDGEDQSGGPCPRLKTVTCGCSIM